MIDIRQSRLGYRSGQVALELRKDVENGVFPAHCRLPSEIELCRRFGVTRPTVRRAIAQLREEGLVSVKRGVGSFVNSSSTTRNPASSKTISVMYPFDTKSLVAIQAMVNEAGHLLCAYSQMDWYWDTHRERRFLEAVRDERRKGLVAFCSPKEPRNDDLLEEIAGLGTRVVHIEPYSEELPGQSYILPDYGHAGYSAICRFVMAGYEDIRFVSMGGAPYEKLLVRGGLDALREIAPHITPDENFVLPVLVADQPEGWDSMRRFLRTITRPTALMCCSSGAAEILLHLAQESGTAVPDMLGIAGVWHDDQPKPPCADHFVVSHLDMARKAIQVITNEPWRGVRRLVKPEWISRGTLKHRSVAP